jgi:hypothetical protein
VTTQSVVESAGGIMMRIGVWVAVAASALAACDDEPPEEMMVGEAGASAPESGWTSGASTGGVASSCGSAAIELQNVEVTASMNRILGSDLALEFDAAAGHYACLQEDGQRVRISAFIGPLDHPVAFIVLDVRDGEGAYDLATADFEAIELTIHHQMDDATVVFGTATHDATGTVDVIALPREQSTSVDLTAVGEIGGADGWVFDFNLAGVAP